MGRGRGHGQLGLGGDQERGLGSGGARRRAGGENFGLWALGSGFGGAVTLALV